MKSGRAGRDQSAPGEVRRRSSARISPSSAAFGSVIVVRQMSRYSANGSSAIKSATPQAGRRYPSTAAAANVARKTSAEGASSG